MVPTRIRYYRILAKDVYAKVACYTKIPDLLNGNLSCKERKQNKMGQKFTCLFCLIIL